MLAFIMSTISLLSSWTVNVAGGQPYSQKVLCWTCHAAQRATFTQVGGGFPLLDRSGEGAIITQSVVAARIVYWFVKGRKSEMSAVAFLPRPCDICSYHEYLFFSRVGLGWIFNCRVRRALDCLFPGFQRCQRR